MYNTPGAELVPFLIIAIPSVLAIVISTYALVQFGKARRMYRAFMTGTDNKNLETSMLELAERVSRLEDDRTAQGKHLRELERKLSYAVQRIGMVRFNAFNDAGGELSFAVALLDSEGNGVVVSSIYGRAEARVYAKPVVRGKSSIHLSGEEQRAIEQAMAKSQKSELIIVS